MKAIKILVSLPKILGDRLRAEKQKGVTASGLIRHLLQQHFKSNRAA
jgi:hypothetical protein